MPIYHSTKFPESKLAKKGWVANNKYCSKGNNILLHSDNYIDGKLINQLKL